VLHLSECWDGGDTRSTYLHLTGSLRGRLTFAGWNQGEPPISFVRWYSQWLDSLQTDLEIAQESWGRAELEARAMKLPLPARLAFATTLSQRALRDAAQVPGSHQPILPLLTEALGFAWQKLRGQPVDYRLQVEALHQQIEASILFPTSENELVTETASAVGWTLGLLDPRAARWLPLFPLGTSRRRSPADAHAMGHIPWYVGNAADRVLARTYQDWRGNNLREIAWRQALLDTLERGAPTWEREGLLEGDYPHGPLAQDGSP
jgi:hypothetical protein